MTASYDGRLLIPLKGKGIEPCCPRMHDALYSGVIYRGTADKRPCAALRLGDKRGLAITMCPWCGARPEVVE